MDRIRRGRAFVQMHDALHESLGLSRRAHGILLALSAQILLKSGHALKATHLRHHGKCLGGDDPEGAPAHWSLPRYLLSGRGTRARDMLTSTWTLTLTLTLTLSLTLTATTTWTGTI